MIPPRQTALIASDRNVDVWLVCYDEIADPRLHAEYRALLTDEERGRELNFYFPDDRKCYLVTRALVRLVLSKYLAVAPADWRFDKNSYGRPRIANFGECGLRFSISHTRGLIALGVTQHRELGVDTENVRTRPMPFEIANRFLARAEIEELSTLPPERRQDRFFEYWTFKESYIKARGMGLSIPLGQFSFHYPGEHTVRIAIDPQLEDTAERWAFWQFRPTAEHLLAVCVEQRNDPLPSLTIRRTIPLLTEQVLQLAASKSSDRECRERIDDFTGATRAP